MVETALSIAFDAALLPGESTAVVVQGAVGLLVTACLKELHPLSPVTVVEPDPARREAALIAGANNVLSPSQADACVHAIDIGAEAYGADVSIDCSGSGGGLDTAIRMTRDGGKVVVASWFGSQTVALQSLGGRFHRSHISLVASKVSQITAALRARWTKKRRFRLAWRLLQRIRPAKILRVTLADVTTAPALFAQINEGRHLQVIFEYR
eukprot:IDg22490t1